MFTDKRYSLEFKMNELHSTIRFLRKSSELDELCFRIYSPGEDINLDRLSLEKEAKNYGYKIYFKSGAAGTMLGILKDVKSEYWG